MAKKARWKQGISAVALTAVVWTGTAVPMPHAMAAAKPFTDVPAGYWAEKHIVKLALQGIISGKGAGKFVPGESLRREDAVILAIRLLGLTDQIDSSGTIAFPGSFKVDDYAIPYINEAFKRKILITDEEYALANQEGGKSWGQAPATREWVAKLLVRAIGKEAEATANAGKATTFADDAKIDAEFRPYVLTAVQNGLVAGIETNIGGVKKFNFDPKTAINRAAIATLFSKAQSKVSVAYSGQVSGVLLAIGADKLTVLYDNGSIKTHALTSGSLITRHDSNVATAVGSLKLYGKATLLLGRDDSVAYVEQTDDKAFVKSVEGTFSRLNTDSGTIWLSVGNDFEKVPYDKTFEPAVTDVQGKSIKLTDIPEGATVNLKVDTIRPEGRVIAVAVKQSVVNKSGTGVVTEWNPVSGDLKVSDVASGTTEVLAVSPTATFKEGDTFVTPDKLKVGTTVFYEVKTGIVVGVQFEKPAQTTISGKLLDINKTTKSIQYFVGNDLNAKLYSGTPTVKIEGLTDAGLDDLQKDDAITLTLDGSGKVTQIAVTGRSVVIMQGATVGDYVPATKTLSLTDPAGVTKNLILVPSTRYDLNGISLPEATALPMIDVPGKKLMIGYSGDNAVFISIVAKYSGTVLENNVTSKTLKIKTDGTSNTVTLPYSFPLVEIYGQSSSSFTDVKVGDQVTVLLNNSQDQAATIQVQKNAQLEVVSTDAASMKFRGKKPGTNTVEEWTVPSTAVLHNENGAAITLSHFTAGSAVNVTFVGKSIPVKIKSVSSVYGRVTSVNAAAGTVELALANGGTATKTVGSSPIVLRDGTTLSSLSSVQPNERVEVRTDENNSAVIQIISPLQKKFWEFSSTANVLKIQRDSTNLSEQYMFTIDSQTYIHQGTTTLTAGQLKNGDSISIYVLRGKVVEVSKN